MPLHELKTWQPYFDAVWEGVKKFEVRKNDRHFHVGDMVNLRDYDPVTKMYSGRRIEAEITYILDNPQYCVKDYVIFSIMITARIFGDEKESDA